MKGADMGSIQVVRGADLAGGKDPDGITRRTGRMGEPDGETSLGVANIEPGTTSGWHHHGDHISYVYVLMGRLHIDWGPGGGEAFDLDGGDFYVVPPRTIHREGNPGADEVVLAVFYQGTGPLSISVEHAEEHPAGVAGDS